MVKTVYDIYNNIQQNSMLRIEQISHTDSIVYNTSEISVRAYETGMVFYVEITYDGQEFSYIAPDCENVHNLFVGLINKKITIDRITDVTIIVQGHDNKNIKCFNKLRAVILSAIGILVGLFSILMCLGGIGSVIFDETLDFSLMAVDIVFVMMILISISLVKYAILQSKYKRRIWMVIIGYVFIGFWSCPAILMMIEDYDKVNGYSVDTIGALAVMIIFTMFGVLILLFSKKTFIKKQMLLTRIPVLPDTVDADAIFRYMDKACNQGRLPFEEIISTGRYGYGCIDDCELDLFMKYSADKLSISIDDTLFFYELLTVLSKDILDNFDESNVAKYYYEENK